jgi:hypothetical protein
LFLPAVGVGRSSDKVCDHISDAIVDTYLRRSPDPSRHLLRPTAWCSRERRAAWLDPPDLLIDVARRAIREIG